MNTKPTVISLFAGCGGSSLGYQLAGYKEFLAIDYEKHAVETFKQNFKDIPIWQRDIKEVSGQEILDFCNIKKGELDLLDGSPPCQGFSTSGKRHVDDTRNDLVNEYIRLIDELRPKVFVMENVSGMIKGKMKGHFKNYMRAMKKLPYKVKAKLMNAKYYNVPQSRERIIFIGIRNELEKEPIYPIPNKQMITVRQAIKDIEPKILDNHSKSAQKIWNKIKIGSNGFYLNGKQTHYNYMKVNPNRPAPTMLKSIKYCGAGYYHWKENRSLSIEEMKALCSFPQSFKLSGKFAEQWARIGNSVPPKMMEAIALSIKISIFSKKLGAT